MTSYQVEFAYSEPHFSSILVEGLSSGDEVDKIAEDQIMMSFPEAYDIEIMKVTQVDG